MAVPSRSYDCDVVDLAATNPEMYRIQDFSIFRVATLIDDAKNFAINYQVVERWNYPYYPESNKVIFSSSPAKIQNQVTHITQQVENPNSSFRQQQQAAINNATSWLTSADGYVVAVKDDNGAWKELLFLDTPDASTAKNVLRINTNGIGFSTTGVNGPYRNAWTIDGSLVADFITTGTINAALVKVINLIADHVVSKSGGLEMSLWAAVFKLLENDNLRVRIYSTGAGAGGLVQVFSGAVTDAGGLGEDAYYSYLGPKGLGLGQRKDGGFEGTLNCGTTSCDTASCDTVNIGSKQTLSKGASGQRIGWFDQISADGSAPLSVQWKYSAELDCFVLCEKK